MAEKRKPAELAAEELRWTCPAQYLPFKTTDDSEPLEGIIGQQRAIDAIMLGLEVHGDGYNIFVTGLTGPDRIHAVEQILKQARKPGAGPPPDICCVHNFKDPDSPRILRLPAGQGAALKRDLNEFIESLKKTIPQIFESEEYKVRKKAITEGFHDKQRETIKEFEKKVDLENFKIVQVQMGPFTRPAILPVVMGNPMPLEQLESLVEKGEYPRETFERLKQKHAELSTEMENIFVDLQKREQDFEERMKTLDKELVSPLLRESIELVREKYQNEKLTDYLRDLVEDLLANFTLFLPRREKEGQAPPQPSPDLLTEYQVNVLVDNAATEGTPIVVEKNPNYRNLFGGIEKVLDPRYGVWRSDFSRIKAGSLLAANGGYLVINFIDAALEPGVWPTLKRVLKNKSVEVQSFDPLYLFTMSTLKPEPIELDVKVVLLGDNRLYYLLYGLDEDFSEIFKIKADFDLVLDNERETVQRYASFMRNTCQEKGLKPLDRSGIAAVVWERGGQRGGQVLTACCPNTHWERYCSHRGHEGWS